MKYFLCLIILTWFTSCSEKPTFEDQSFTLEKVDSMAFEVSPLVNVNSYCVKYYMDGNREYVFWGNRLRNSIEIFDVNSGKHFKTILFPREGPNSVPHINRGFSILSWDSIFVSTSELGKIPMLDSSGILRKMFNYTDTSYYSANNLIGLNTKIHSDIWTMNGNLVFPFDIPQFPATPSDSTIHNLQLFKLYNIETGHFSPSNLHLDPEIYDPNSLFIASSNAMLDDRYYYQIATQSGIRFTDDFIHQNIKDARSRYHTSYVKMSDYSTDIYGYIAKEFSYRSLLADPFRHVIYRTVKLPVNDIQTADLDKEFSDVYERFSIMILNEELNVLGERLFEHSNYSWNECFVGKQGLYILRSSYHPGYSETKITFDIYNLTAE